MPVKAGLSSPGPHAVSFPTPSPVKPLASLPAASCTRSAASAVTGAWTSVADGTSHTMRVCAALVSEAGTPTAEATVIPDRGKSGQAIAGVIADGYGRGTEHGAVDAASARYVALRALGEEARGLEERIVALARAHLCPRVPEGESYAVRIENDGAELVAP